MLSGVMPAHGADQFVRVSKVFDGDTVRLSDGRKVRLIGIDTPETRKPDTPGQYYSTEARLLTESLSLGQRVRLVSAGGEGFGRDSHGRVIAEIYLEDGTSLNERLVAAGAAFAYPHPEHPAELTERILQVQRKAIAEHKGFWKRILSEDFAFRPYVGNRNSRRFFSENCQDKNRIAVRNRVAFSSLKAAFTAGYAPARTCLFWPAD